MKHKDEAQPLIKRFSSYGSTKFESHIKKFRSDNGAEFLSLQSFFKDNGVLFQHSYVYTPQQNGVVERKHRHILQVARALKIQAQLPNQFWGECGLTVVHIINRLPSPILSFKTPFERLYSKPLSHSHLRVFGCLAYATNVHVSHKFGHRAITCIFIGYLVGQKAYKLFNLSTRKIFTSRDIHFHENHFPYASSKFVLPPSNLGYSLGPIPTPIHDLASSSFVAPNSDTTTFVAPFSSPIISNPPSLHDEQPNQHPTPDPLKTYTRRPKDAPSRPLAIPTPTSSLPSSPSLLPSHPIPLIHPQLYLACHNQSHQRPLFAPVTPIIHQQNYRIMYALTSRTLAPTNLLPCFQVRLQVHVIPWPIMFHITATSLHIALLLPRSAKSQSPEIILKSSSILNGRRQCDPN